jgi:hypothetical protein
MIPQDICLKIPGENRPSPSDVNFPISPICLDLFDDLVRAFERTGMFQFWEANAEAKETRVGMTNAKNWKDGKPAFDGIRGKNNPSTSFLLLLAQILVFGHGLAAIAFLKENIQIQRTVSVFWSRATRTKTKTKKIDVVMPF